MNKERRKQIRSIVTLLESTLPILQEQSEQLESVTDDEQQSYDNMPEPMQYSERGSEMEDNISTLEEHQQILDDAIEFINTCIENLKEF